MDILLTSYTLLHFVVSDERLCQGAHQQVCALNSSEHLWLAIAIISSTESCVIGYNAHSCIKASVSGSVPASECRFEFSSWWYDALNVLIMNDKIWLYQNPLGSKTWGGMWMGHFEWGGHDASAYRHRTRPNFTILKWHTSHLISIFRTHIFQYLQWWKTASLT